MQIHFRKTLLVLIPIGILLLAAAGMILFPHLLGSILHPFSPPPSGNSPLAGQVMVLSPSLQPELWAVSPDGLEHAQLTKTGGKVLDFAISPDGWQVLYSVQNVQGGSDLHLLRLDGLSDRKMVSCGGAACDSPAWACDGKQAAFRRGTAPLVALQKDHVSKGSTQIVLLDISTGETRDFEPERSFTGILPAWSPNCQFFSFYDTDINSIRLIDLNIEKGNVLLPAVFEAWWSWSPDGQFLYFLNQSTPEDFSHNAVYRYNLQTGSAELAFKESAQDYDYSPVSFAPDGTMVYGRRIVGVNPARQLWLTLPGNATPVQITFEESCTHTNARWNKAGNAIVYQQFELDNADALPQVRIWQQSTRLSQTIAEDAIYPAWVPTR